MASVSYGPIVDNIRGSIGGTTFSRAHSGNTARSRPAPPRPSSPSQVSNQQLLARIAQHWATLSAAYIDGWKAYALTVTLTNSLGQTYHPTAFQAFVNSNVLIQKLNPAMWANVAPAVPGSPTTPIFSFAVTAHNLTITAISPALVTNNWFYMSVTHPDRVLAHNRQRVFSFTAGFYGITLPLTIGAAIDTGIPAGTLVQSFICYRFMDQYFRVSTLQKTAFQWTTA